MMMPLPEAQTRESLSNRVEVIRESVPYGTRLSLGRFGRQEISSNTNKYFMLSPLGKECLLVRLLVERS